MATEPFRRTPGGTMSDLEPEERRGWLSHGIAALAISALGLAVAGSVVVTTNAQTTTAVVPPSTAVVQSDPQLPQLPGIGEAPKTLDAVPLAAFTRRSSEAEEESRSDVRSAIIEERAAQRSEDLTESAEDIAATALQRGSDARKAELAKADRQRRIAAIEIARERTRRAIQIRVTAEVQRELAAKKAEEERRERARRAAEANNSSNDSSNNSSNDSSNSSSSSNDSGNSSNNDSGNSSGNSAPAPAPRAPQNDSSSSSGGGGGGAASPVPGAIVGASFGATGAWSRYHTGLDFRAGFGTPIKAVTSGVVTYAGSKGNWAGNHVAIRHSGGYSTMSSHMQSISVSAGQNVSAGQVIGYVGSTGRSFGAHLHFEVYPPGVSAGDVYSAINPIPWLRSRGVNTN